VHVPYPNTGLVLAGLRGDSVHVAFEFVAPVMGLLKAGQFRALAVTTRHRNPDLPNVPTMEESGLPGYEVTSWNGIGVPAKTPRAIVDRLNQAANEALASADLKQRFHEMSVEPFPGTPESYRKHIAAEIAKWTRLVETAKIPKQ
jgi:tripartite-type tricarboxylate transporter receptor subunit TctC